MGTSSCHAPVSLRRFMPPPVPRRMPHVSRSMPPPVPRVTAPIGHFVPASISRFHQTSVPHVISTEPSPVISTVPNPMISTVPTPMISTVLPHIIPSVPTPNLTTVQPPATETMLPKGPWTLVLGKFPAEFSDATMRNYSATKNPVTGSLKGYDRGLKYYDSKKIVSLLIHYGQIEICVKGVVRPSFRNFSKYGENYCHKLHFFLDL